MAKVGYIFKADRYDGLEADKEWMEKYGCVQVIEESVDNEALRPKWKQLVARSRKRRRNRGGQIQQRSPSGRANRPRSSSCAESRWCVSYPSMTGSYSRGKLFPETTAADVLEMSGALPEEVAVLRYSSAHVMNLQQKAKVPKKTMKATDRCPPGEYHR